MEMVHSTSNLILPESEPFVLNVQDAQIVMYKLNDELSETQIKIETSQSTEMSIFDIKNLIEESNLRSQNSFVVQVNIFWCFYI